MLRGDTDFSLTTEFDRWDADGVRFVFGYDANANLVQAAERQPEDLYHELVAKAEREIATRPRTRPTNVKDDIVRHRGYKTIRTKTQEIVEFSYRPRACKQDYRVIALRKPRSCSSARIAALSVRRLNGWTHLVRERLGAVVGVTGTCGGSYWSVRATTP